MKRNKDISGVWDDCFLFLNPIDNYQDFKKVCDLPVITQIIGGFASLFLSVKSLIAICFFAPFMGINMLLKP